MDIPRPDNFNETYLYEGMSIGTSGLQAVRELAQAHGDGKGTNKHLILQS
jgi:hypothetical protein